MDDAPPTMHLSEEQASAVVGLERTGASLSMIGVFLIIVTFTIFKRLRTVPNTFILFASIANIGASTASLIGLTGIAAGSDSSLCRAQAFLLEMFMQADPWWSFAMAFNVYLVFFHSANPTTFRRYLWVYCSVCFGLPMIPAIVCLYIYSPEKGPVYGDATLWCWIGDRWNALRIYSYYIPIWVCIFLSAVIYIAVGYHVFHQRNQLRNLTLSNQAKDISNSEIRGSAEKNLTSANRGREPSRIPEVYGTVTTEVQITSDACDPNASDHTPPMTPLGSPITCPWSEDIFHSNMNRNNSSSNTGPCNSNHKDISKPTTNITAGHGLAIDEELGNAISPPKPVHSIHGHGMNGAKYYHATSTTVISSLSPRNLSSTLQQHDINSSTHHLQPQNSNVHYQGDAEESSIGISQSRTGANPMTGTNLYSSSGIPATNNIGLSFGARTSRAWRRFTGKLHHMDPVKLAYLRTSFVFAISVLVTWTPSSINRVYNLIYPNRISYGLNIASAAVLPLQGVWNAVIYFSTSWNLLHDEILHVYTRSGWLRQLRLHRTGSTSLTSATRQRIPGIVIDSHSNGMNHSNSTEMGTVLCPIRSQQAGLDSGGGGIDNGRGSGSGSQRAFVHCAHDSGRSHHHHHAGLHGMCYGDDDSTESDSVDGEGSLGQISCRYRPAIPATLDFADISLQSTPQVGIIRIQRGGELDT